MHSSVYFLIRIIIIVLINSASLPLFAQNSRGATPIEEKHTVGKTYAMIIGISNYQYIPDLLYADQDALEFKEYLLSNKYSLCDSNNIEIFLNQQATKINILDALSSMFSRTNKGDKLYFYFAGHGDIEDMSQSENGLLLLQGAPEKNYFGLTDEVLQINQMVDYFGKLQERGVDVSYIIDACHSGKLVGGARGRNHTYNAIQNLYFGNSTLMLSCSANQLSLEGIEWGGGHGIFSYYLHQGLQGLADIDRDNTISLLELENYVKKNTYIESEKKQTPVFLGDQNKILNQITDSLWLKTQLQKESIYSEYSTINFKGKEQLYLKDCDENNQKLYYASIELLNSNQLTSLNTENAYSSCQKFIQSNPDNYLSSILRRKLITKLNQSFDSIVRPLIQGKKPIWTRPLISKAKTEIDSCLKLISKKHYLYPHILSRKYYLESIWCSYGININNYGPLDASPMKDCIYYLHLSRQLEPNAAYIYYSLGRAYQTILNSDSSLVYLEKFARLIPNSALAHNMLGISYGDINQFRLSASEFHKAILLDSSIMQSYANLIYIYTKLNLYDSAINLAIQALKLFPNFTGLKNNLTDLYLQTGKKTEALQLIEESLRSDSLNISTLLLKGEYYFRQSDFKQAESIFSRILSFKKDYKPAIYYLAKTYKSQKDFRKSIEVIRSLLSMDPDDVKSNYYLGEYYNLLELKDSANLQFSKIIQIASGRKEYSELIGDIYYYYLNQPEKSEKYYAEVIQKDSFNLELLTKYCSNLICNNKSERLDQYMVLMKTIPNHENYVTYIKIAQNANHQNYRQAIYLLDNMNRQSTEYKWRFINDPVMSKLIELPEVREIIQ